MSASKVQDMVAAPPPDSVATGTVTAADGAYLHQLQQELRQLAVHQAVVDDLSFAYQLQLEEVLQASAGRPGMDVKATMFAPESEECLQRRAAVEAQAKLYDAAIAAQADKALAHKVHNEQTERVKESCKDHKLAKDVELKGEAVLHHPHLQRQDVPAAAHLICAACDSNIKGAMGYAAALRSSADEIIWFGQGMVKEPMEDVAELRAVLGGLQKAHDHGVLDLVLCLRPELLQQPGSLAMQARLTPAMAAYRGCKLPCNTAEVNVTACCMGFGEGCIDPETQTQTEPPESSSNHEHKEELVCGICMEDVHQAVMHSIGGCMHQFCKGCLERHIQTQMRCKPLPVQCPAVSCHQGIDVDECTVLLRSPADINRLTQLEAEAKISEAARFYCPQRDCSNLLIVKKTTLAEASRVDDSDTLSLATEKGWKRCPSCRHVIERQTGCNHITCRCGSQLCYACGTGYVRGRKQCKCELFEVGNALDADPDRLHHAGGVHAAFADFEQFIRRRTDRLHRGTARTEATSASSGRRPDPALYKTVNCRNWRAGHCTYGARCSFAHGAIELRTVSCTTNPYLSLAYRPVEGPHQAAARARADSSSSSRRQHLER
ncbi:hypothetical protein WJX77_005784 [Trebouxia sp. C0004]